MAFQTKGSFNDPSSATRLNSLETQNSSAGSSRLGASPATMDNLIAQIAEEVRQRLLSQGVPMAPARKAHERKFESASWARLIDEGADRIGNAADLGPFQAHSLRGDEELASKIDHTLLKPDATREEILHICQEARKYHFATVCVNSTYVGIAAEALQGSTTKAIAVVGFPLGAAATATKAFEAREAIRAGAQEIDMVLNIGALKSKDYSLVESDIKQVVEASKPFPVKVILETSNLNEDQKIIGCALSKAAGAAFVKTSTGFGAGGATAEDVALMRRVVGPEMGVKASGGIKTYEDAAKMLAAGATRIGASASIAIVTHKNASPSKIDGKKFETGKFAEEQPKKPFKNSLY